MRLCWGGLHVEGAVKGCKLHVMSGVWGLSVVAQHVVEHTQQTLDTLLAHTLLVGVCSSTGNMTNQNRFDPFSGHHSNGRSLSAKLLCEWFTGRSVVT